MLLLYFTIFFSLAHSQTRPATRITTNVLSRTTAPPIRTTITTTTVAPTTVPTTTDEPDEPEPSDSPDNTSNDNSSKPPTQTPLKVNTKTFQEVMSFGGWALAIAQVTVCIFGVLILSILLYTLNKQDKRDPNDEEKPITQQYYDEPDSPQSILDYDEVEDLKQSEFAHAKTISSESSGGNTTEVNSNHESERSESPDLKKILLNHKISNDTNTESDISRLPSDPYQIQMPYTNVFNPPRVSSLMPSRHIPPTPSFEPSPRNSFLPPINPPFDPILSQSFNPRISQSLNPRNSQIFNNRNSQIYDPRISQLFDPRFDPRPSPSLDSPSDARRSQYMDPRASRLPDARGNRQSQLFDPRGSPYRYNPHYNEPRYSMQPPALQHSNYSMTPPPGQPRYSMQPPPMQNHRYSTQPPPQQIYGPPPPQEMYMHQPPQDMYMQQPPLDNYMQPIPPHQQMYSTQKQPVPFENPNNVPQFFTPPASGVAPLVFDSVGEPMQFDRPPNLSHPTHSTIQIQDPTPSVPDKELSVTKITMDVDEPSITEMMIQDTPISSAPIAIPEPEPLSITEMMLQDQDISATEITIDDTPANPTTIVDLSAAQSPAVQVPVIIPARDGSKVAIDMIQNTPP
ncbi:hypothetical protein BC833DRAFT_593199 [Globomyces pollinis-pini]|nr:hypothetical protein BC833DRAFT_593199 [Globomyces pollinis-pini]